MSMSSQQSDIKLFEQIDRNNNRMKQLDEISLGDKSSPILFSRFEGGNATGNARRNNFDQFFPSNFGDCYMGDSDGASPSKTTLH